MKVSAKFKPQDLWVGAYWERGRASGQCVIKGEHRPVVGQCRPPRTLDIWICLLPMLPIKLHFGPSEGRNR